jgi:iron(III) transport system substrate-binding protein
MIRWCVIAVCAAALIASLPVAGAELHRYPARGAETAVLKVHGATDASAMEPLLLDFQSLHPGTSIEYVDYVSNELLAATEEACRTGRVLTDILVTPAVDHLIKLANDGCAREHRSTAANAAPKWANWRHEVFGFTYEPAVIVYNTALVPSGDIPRSHVELADLLRAKSAFYRGRVGTYDIRQSGIGYLFAFSDSKQASTTFGRLIESMGRVQPTVRCCTGEIVEEVARGQLLLGYNLLGAYAYARMRAGAPIGVVLPRDYTLVLSRGVMIPAFSRQPELARQLLDYLLSDRGQEVGRGQSFFFAANADLPPGVDGPASLASSGIARPITIGPALLPVQDRAQRERFLTEWSRSILGLSANPR